MYACTPLFVWCVRYTSAALNHFEAKSGVPQGCILGTLLLLLK